MKWRTAAAAVSLMLVLAGCSATSPTADEAPTPEATPTLGDPVELDYYATLVVDDGAGHALVTDWSGEKLHAIDSSGDDLWSIDAQLNDETGGGIEAYSVGDTAVVHDRTGEIKAYSWADGSEVWSFQIPGEPNSCHPAQDFGSQTTGTSPILGGGDLIILEYQGMSIEGGCEPASEGGNPVVFALNPATGKEAWPTLSVGQDGKTFGGTLLNISPDGKYGIASWADGDESLITRIALDSGRHVTVPITSARSIDTTGVDYYDVFPTTDPTSMLYVYGSEDPDNPYSSAVTRAARLTLPDGLPESDSATLKGLDETVEVKMQDTMGPVCAAELAFSPSGKPACIQAQLFASVVKFQGSDGSPQGWFADAPEIAVEAMGFHGAPQTAPVDTSDGTLLVVPGQESGIMALNAETGEMVWAAGDYAADEPWGGQGILPELDLVIVADNGNTSFYESASGKLVYEQSAGDYAQLSSGRRVVLTAANESTTMWSVVDI